MVKQKYLDKAEVLIEALPYIQRFNRKIIVVKYGGSAMVDENLKKSVIQDVVLLKLVGFKPIIVHGGGKEISRWVNKVGKEAKFINGLRVTDEETMEIAEMVLSKVNKELVTLVESLGVKAVGVSGKDGALLTVEKKYSEGQDIGFVGNITDVNPKILYDLLEKDFRKIHERREAGVPYRYRRRVPGSERSGKPDLQAVCKGSKGTDQPGKCRRRHDPQASELHRCH